MTFTTTTSMHSVYAVLILDASDGKRVLAKYYPPTDPSVPFAWRHVKDQKQLERTLFEKTKRQPSGEVVLIDGQHLAVYRSQLDVLVYVIGSVQDNELALMMVVQSLTDALQMVLKPPGGVEKRLLLENMDVLVLILDEVLDEGIILENDATQIASKVARRPDAHELPLSEQTFSQAFGGVKESFMRSLLK